MREFLATFIALAIILGAIWPFFELMSFISSTVDSIFVYFVAGFIVGVFKTKIGSAILSFVEDVWELVSRIIYR